ncbi:MAG TPA: hypothetical protein VE988_29340 [Gemmataceae bacterium]|nr:hypothetical protein [Gemmataceae bacterium]
MRNETSLSSRLFALTLAIATSVAASVAAGRETEFPVGMANQQANALKLEDARKALADLAAKKLDGIYSSPEEIQKAEAIKNAKAIDLLKFRISLEDKYFVYWAIKTDQVKDYTEGIFVLDANGQWTAQITQRTRAHQPLKKKR